MLPCRVLPVVAMADASDVSLSKPIAILEQTRPPRLAPAGVHVPTFSSWLAPRRRPSAYVRCRWQVATRKVNQLIVLVDKMEQAQSALETKLRGTEVRHPSPHGTPPPPAIANVSMLARQAKLKAEQENSQRLTEELADVNVRAAPPRLSHRLPPACPTLVAAISPALTPRRWARAVRPAVQKTLQEERMIRDVQRKDLEKTRATLTGPSPAPAPSTPGPEADVWCAGEQRRRRWCRRCWRTRRAN